MVDSQWKRFFTKRRLVALLLGQILSVLITFTSYSSSELAKEGIDAPTSQSFLNYALLALVYGSVMIYRKKALKVKWYCYILLGLVDVEANFCVVKAFQYTSMTSVMLLDCWIIPCVMFLTWMFLGTKYRYKKITGVFFCVGGAVMVVFSDVYSADWSGGSNPAKGDVLAIAGSTLYAISNVTEEYLVKNASRVELMSMLGLFGALVSAIQISILERNELKSIKWTAGAAFPFFGFSVAMFLFYSLVPVLLKISGSTMFNLSLMTSDMWAVVIRISAYREKIDWLYFVAFATVTVGLVIYGWGDKDDQKRAAVARQERLDEEANAGVANNDSSNGNNDSSIEDNIAENRKDVHG